MPEYDFSVYVDFGSCPEVPYQKPSERGNYLSHAIVIGATLRTPRRPMAKKNVRYWMSRVRCAYAVHHAVHSTW
jgi:hypothetical protein